VPTTRKWLGVVVLFVALLKFCVLSVSAQEVVPPPFEENLRQQKEANLVQARSLLLDNLSLKKEEALAVSVDTVLQNPDPSISQADRGKLVSLFIEHFDAPTIEEQRRWLEEKWSTVRGAQWEPTLRGIAAKYVDYPVPNAPNVLPAYNYFKL
jgi:hypothetical protein